MSEELKISSVYSPAVYLSTCTQCEVVSFALECPEFVHESKHQVIWLEMKVLSFQRMIHRSVGGQSEWVCLSASLGEAPEHMFIWCNHMDKSLGPAPLTSTISLRVCVLSVLTTHFYTPPPLCLCSITGLHPAFSCLPQRSRPGLLHNEITSNVCPVLPPAVSHCKKWLTGYAASRTVSNVLKWPLTTTVTC